MSDQSIPATVLNLVNEHTSGGFIIFYVDKHGKPNWKTYMDNETLGRGLMAYIEDTIESIREIERVSRINEISESYGETDIEL